VGDGDGEVRLADPRVPALEDLRRAAREEVLRDV
ncbi:MAG: hypothetical protein AVDCRST_MAG30-199, partial [uncultured Solirubrobacteraceae bacterium]